MAIIVHRCFECGHPDVFQHAGIDGKSNRGIHDGRNNCGQGPSKTPAACHRGNCQWGPPALMPQYAPDGTPLPGITPPGTPQRWLSAGITCACPACVAYYEAKAATA
jgi:hypothetical protein